MRIDHTVAEAGTIPAVFFARVQASHARIAYTWKAADGWRDVTFGEYGEQALRLARGLRALGVGPGDCVAVWGATTPEWTICDLAAMTAGAHVAGVYQTSTPEQAAHILNDSRAKVVCVDSSSRLDVIASLRANLPHLLHVMCWNEALAGAEALSLEAVVARGADSGLTEAGLLAEIAPEARASLVYTSGTTGPPKGVILDHASCVWCCHAVLEDSDLLIEDDSTICYLPLSHVAEHASFLARLYAGIRMIFCPDMDHLGHVMKEKSPTYLLGVPRVYEKIHGRIMAVVAKTPPRRQRLVAWALDIGGQVSVRRRDGEAPGSLLWLQWKIADALVLSKIRAALGGRLRFLVSGSAPMDVEIITFFEALGIVFIEAYGLSESGGISHLNRARARRPGTVGQAAAGVECRIAEDGEVLLRSPMLFRGYLNQPEATREILDADGWLHSGDIGEIDKDGFLRITDRKKNLIITAGGKNVAPAAIEVLLQREPLINQVVVVGDRRPYLVALMTVTAEVARHEHLSEAAVRERVAAAVAAANARLARYEQIKKFAVIPGEFSIESGELTPTMKIRRNKVVEHYRETIQSLYDEREQVELAG